MAEGFFVVGHFMDRDGGPRVALDIRANCQVHRCVISLDQAGELAVRLAEVVAGLRAAKDERNG